jgi:hypothetical protein
MKKSQLKQIIKEELQKILIEITVSASDPALQNIWKAYLKHLQETLDPELSPDNGDAFSHINSPKVSSITVSSIDKLVSAIVKVDYEVTNILDEPEGAYYGEDTRPSIMDICQELNFTQTKELISKLDAAYDYNETL